MKSSYLKIYLALIRKTKHAFLIKLKLGLILHVKLDPQAAHLRPNQFNPGLLSLPAFSFISASCIVRLFISTEFYLSIHFM